MSDFEKTIEDLKAAGMHRSVRTVEPIDAARLRVDGREVLSFSGNDYLGLRMHPEVVAGAESAMKRYGLGAGASRLLAGSTPVHAELESALAEFAGAERALVFSSGYQTNLAVLSALAGEDDVLILDALCHASLIDGAKLSKARLRVYPHGNMKRLGELLASHANFGRRFVVTEGIFSMDGDVASLAEIASLVERHDAWLILDDAHAFGVLGPRGRGTAEHLGVTLPVRTIFVATLSKVLGSQGGFAAGSAAAVDMLVNHARSFIYTTGLSPACAGGALAALKIVKEPARRERLLSLCSTARRLLRAIVPSVPEGVSPIIPIVVGEVERAVGLSAQLFEQGIYAPAIRPPTVPKGTARLRISLSADHTEEQVERLARSLKQAMG